MGQFANDSMTPSPLTVTRDQYMNEVPTDKPMHTDSTPGMGSWSFDEGHYSDDFKGGYSGYGVSVTPSNSVERTTVDNSKADRGKES
jgi:hypothetical protein